MVECGILGIIHAPYITKNATLYALSLSVRIGYFVRTVYFQSIEGMWIVMWYRFQSFLAVSIKSFKSKTQSILTNFIRIELNRLKRIHFSEDLSQHIANEFKYLKEKSVKVLAERENSL
jgi:hypothetical protein